MGPFWGGDPVQPGSSHAHEVSLDPAGFTEIFGMT